MLTKYGYIGVDYETYVMIEALKELKSELIELIKSTDFFAEKINLPFTILEASILKDHYVKVAGTKEILEIMNKRTGNLEAIVDTRGRAQYGVGFETNTIKEVLRKTLSALLTYVAFILTHYIADNYSETLVQTCIRIQEKIVSTNAYLDLELYHKFVNLYENLKAVTRSGTITDEKLLNSLECVAGRNVEIVYGNETLNIYVTDNSRSYYVKIEIIEHKRPLPLYIKTAISKDNAGFATEVLLNCVPDVRIYYTLDVDTATKHLLRLKAVTDRVEEILASASQSIGCYTKV